MLAKDSEVEFSAWQPVSKQNVYKWKSGFRPHCVWRPHPYPDPVSDSVCAGVKHGEILDVSVPANSFTHAGNRTGFQTQRNTFTDNKEGIYN